jgi:deoxyribodipyrimidine photolyase-related protein
MTSEAFLILGDQLFAPEHFRPFKVERAFMAEDVELCEHYLYHKKKLVLYLSAMRHFAESSEMDVTYEKFAKDLRKTPPFVDRLTKFLKKNKITALHFFEIQDKFFETRIKDVLEKLGVEAREHQTPKFICGRKEFETYLSSVKKPFMKTFYEQQRKKREVLLTEDGGPVGGKWSFDEENRKPFKKGLVPPPVGWLEPDDVTKTVMKLVADNFPKHPGDVEGFGYPVTHDEAKDWLRRFLKERFKDFGPYEDSITSTHDTIYHSVMTPTLNTGLITPGAVIKTALAYAKKHDVPMNSLEGFVRQITGWREFIHGIYRHYSVRQEDANFFKHHRKLKDCWWDGTTGIPPLDDVIKKAGRLAYCHHIERLMIAGNLLLLTQTDPHDAHRWFMEMFIDSADWVMGPNVYGMTQFSDGGIFATKPYICGSNYLLKMGDYKRGEWCDTVDGLYWTFIEDHKDYFTSNPRLSVMPMALGRIKPEKMERHRQLAKDFRARVSSAK